MLFKKLERLAESSIVSKRKKVDNQKYVKGKAIPFLTVFMIIGIMFPMLAGCGQANKDEGLPATISTVETTTMEDAEATVSDEATTISCMVLCLQYNPPRS